MPATPADIAKYTSDGVAIYSPSDPAISAALKATHPNAQDLGETEIEMFYDSAADAQAMLDETFMMLSQINPPYEAVEIDDTMGFGTSIPLAPNVPKVMLVDAIAGFQEAMRVRAIAQQMGSDRYAVELLK